MMTMGTIPISVLKLVHGINSFNPVRYCEIHNAHTLKSLSFTYGKAIYNLDAGLYKINIDGVDYVFDLYYKLVDGDFIVINNANDIKLYRSLTYHTIIPYKLKTIKSIVGSNTLQNTINSTVDCIAIDASTKYSGYPSMNNPMDINRIVSMNIKTSSGNNSDSLKINFKGTFGSLPNGVHDSIIINPEVMIMHNIINTHKEVLSGGMEWEYKKNLSDSKYYVFFAKNNNMKLINSADAIRSSHFEAVACSTLISKSTQKNCISLSSSPYNNGIWVKIAASILDIHGDKDFAQEFQKWLLTKSVSNNPIYVEYQLQNTSYSMSLIDEYHVKTFQGNTNISVEDNIPFSVFYKSFA